MDNWAEDELVLPEVPPAYFTTPSNLLPSQPVSEQMRKDLTALPASVAEVDIAMPDPHEKGFELPCEALQWWHSNLRAGEAMSGGG